MFHIGGAGRREGMGSDEIKLWDPQVPETLHGVFEFYESSHWAVRGENGTVWLLRNDAEEQLRGLWPVEGQAVQILCIHDASGSRFHVSVH